MLLKASLAFFISSVGCSAHSIAVFLILYGNCPGWCFL